MREMSDVTLIVGLNVLLCLVIVFYCLFFLHNTRDECFLSVSMQW